MKLMQDPRVMRLAMQALGARSRAQAAWDSRLRKLAKSLGFATRAEMRDLEAAVRTLQSTLESLRAEADASKNTAK